MRICVYLEVLFVLHSGCEFRRRELQFERAPLHDWWWGRHGACAACQTDRMPSDGPCNTRSYSSNPHSASDSDSLATQWFDKSCLKWFNTCEISRKMIDRKDQFKDCVEKHKCGAVLGCAELRGFVCHSRVCCKGCGLDMYGQGQSVFSWTPTQLTDRAVLLLLPLPNLASFSPKFWTTWLHLGLS